MEIMRGYDDIRADFVVEPSTVQVTLPALDGDWDCMDLSRIKPGQQSYMVWYLSMFTDEEWKRVGLWLFDVVPEALAVSFERKALATTKDFDLDVWWGEWERLSSESEDENPEKMG